MPLLVFELLPNFTWNFLFLTHIFSNHLTLINNLQVEVSKLALKYKATVRNFKKHFETKPRQLLIK